MDGIFVINVYTWVFSDVYDYSLEMRLNYARTARLLRRRRDNNIFAFIHHSQKMWKKQDFQENSWICVEKRCWDRFFKHFFFQISFKHF